MSLVEYYRQIRLRLYLFFIFTIAFGAFCGAGIAWTVGQRQQVIKVVQTQTRVETHTKEVKQKSCLDGQDGIVVAGHSEHESVGDKDNPDAWDYVNLITFNVNGVDHICRWTGSDDLTKVLHVGDKVHPFGGEPL